MLVLLWEGITSQRTAHPAQETPGNAAVSCTVQVSVLIWLLYRDTFLSPVDGRP